MKKKARGDLTVAEAGRLGGLACKRNQKPDYYRKLAKQGGNANFQQHGPEGMAKAGKAGGLAKHRTRGGGKKPKIGITPGVRYGRRDHLDELLDNFREGKGTGE